MIEDMTNYTEDELISKLNAFDLDAITLVYDLYCDAIYRYGYRLLGNQNQAEECVSETFSRFLNSLQKGQGPKKTIRPYLYRTAHNWITDQYRRPLPYEEGLHENIQSNESNPEQLTIIHIENQLTRNFLKDIPANQRQALVLKYLEGLDNNEIAEALNKPVGAVKALQNRGLEALRKKFKVKP